MMTKGNNGQETRDKTKSITQSEHQTKTLKFRIIQNYESNQSEQTRTEGKGHKPLIVKGRTRLRKKFGGLGRGQAQGRWQRSVAKCRPQVRGQGPAQAMRSWRMLSGVLYLRGFAYQAIQIVSQVQSRGTFQDHLQTNYGRSQVQAIVPVPHTPIRVR